MTVIRKSSAWFRVAAVVFCAFVLGFPSVCSGALRKVVIFPFHVTSPSPDKDLRNFSDHINKRLRSTIESLSDAFAVEPEKTTLGSLKGKDAPETDNEALAIALEMNADLVLYGFLSNEDSRFKLKAVMWDVQTGRAIVSTDMKVDNIHALPAVLQLFINSVNRRLHVNPRLPFYRSEAPVFDDAKSLSRAPTLVTLPRNTGPWRSPELGATLLGLDVGDLDGDKKNEIVFLEEGGVTINRFEEGTIIPLTQFSEAPAVFISAEVEDLDGDGISELILCYQKPSGIESAIVTYTNRRFRIAVKVPNVILRTIREPALDAKRRILVGQRTDTENIFNGEMIRYNLEGEKLTPIGNVVLPAGTLVLSYDFGQLGKDGESFRVILNQDQRLMLFDNDNRLVASMRDRIYGHDRRIRIQTPSGAREITCPGRVIIGDTKGDGENELLVVKNGERGSYIQALGWNGNALVEKWKTVESQGSITDFRIRDFKNQDTQSLVLILVKPMPFLALSGPRSVIYAYDLIP